MRLIQAALLTLFLAGLMIFGEVWAPPVIDDTAALASGSISVYPGSCLTTNNNYGTQYPQYQGAWTIGVVTTQSPAAYGVGNCTIWRITYNGSGSLQTTTINGGTIGQLTAFYCEYGPCKITTSGSVKLNYVTNGAIYLFAGGSATLLADTASSWLTISDDPGPSNASIFTTSGCSAGSTAGGPATGQYASGTSGTCTVTVTLGGAAPVYAVTGWVCPVWDLTTPGDVQKQTGSTQDTVTFSGTTVSGDVIAFTCTPY
jgi:hypothetical protein